MLRLKSFALIPLITCLSACSSSTKLSSEQSKQAFDELGYLCNGSQGKRIVSTVSSKFIPVKGIRIEEAARYREDFNRVEDRVFSKWIYHLLSSAYEVQKDGTLEHSYLDQLAYNGYETSPYFHKISSGYPLYRSKGFSFVLLSHPQDEVTDPVAKLPIERTDKFPYLPEELAAETGFYGGTFIADHYLSVPENVRPSLCRKAGLDETCFEMPKGHKTLKKLSHHESEFFFTYLFLNNVCGNCDHDFARDNRTTTLEKLSKDPMLKIRWISAMALDLNLLSDVKVSKTINGDWKTARIEWDTSSICKYRRSKSDFLTN